MPSFSPFLFSVFEGLAGFYTAIVGRFGVVRLVCIY